MAGEKLKYSDYLKAAFNARYPVKGMGKMPLNYLGVAAFGVLGLLNPGFWLIGAGAELAYLFSLSQNQRFRFVVENRLMETTKKTVEERRQEVEDLLPDEDRGRVFALRERCDRIGELSKRTGKTVETHDAHSLASLQVIYTKLLVSRSVLKNQLSQVSVHGLDRQLEDARQKLAAAPVEDVRLQQTLESTVDILNKRIGNLEAARSKLDFIEAELVRIEQQVELIVEEAALSREAGDLSSYIDSVVQTFGETRSWLSSNLDIGEQEIEQEAQYVAAVMQQTVRQ